MSSIFSQHSLCYRLCKKKAKGGHVLYYNELLESSKQKNDCSKEKRILGKYAGTAQDTDWRSKKELDDCGRKDIFR